MKQWNTDRLLSFTAIFVSLATLVIFVHQTSLLRQQNHISILPYLVIGTTNDESKLVFEINAINQGVGPAIIESVHILFKGKTYDLANYEYRLYDVIREIDPGMDSIAYFSSSTLDKGMAIPANTKYNLIAVRNEAADYQKILSIFGRLLSEGLDYQIIYKSILNERWSITGNSEGPVELR